ncbi:MAG: alanine--glyoxylate aminotransferase family protein [Chthoniobacterales bacterium]|nr:alanine--glyoxylate aminotransferase family protein [Chthoniobacterales bacterium]
MLNTTNTTADGHVKLFIPGPVEVSDKTFRAFCHPQIGHRGSEFSSLYEAIHPRLQTMFGTAGPVYLSTSSAWGVMEGSIRNLVQKKVLNCMCGAFSDKWLDVSRRCGKEAEGLRVEWGDPILPEMVEATLSQGGFDAITLIHNETSTGVLNPLADIAAVVKKFPEVMFIVDSVSSFSTMPIPMDELGIDVLLTGSQKALAMPPGLSLLGVSERARERAAATPGRGYYFDFIEFHKNWEKFMTPSTPTTGHIWALQSKLDDIFGEGLEARHARHEKLNRMVSDWVGANGFEHFAREGFRSKSLVCVKNNRDIDVAAFCSALKKKHRVAINGGYGKIKGTTFRISNMGDESEATITELLGWMTGCLPA